MCLGLPEVIIIGPTGSGKTYLSEAIAHQACWLDYDALNTRRPILMEEIRGVFTFLKRSRNFFVQSFVKHCDFLSPRFSSAV